MPYNLLLLPLLGGYIFAEFCYRFRYYTRRADKERLLFRSAIFASFFLFVAYALRYLVYTYIPWLPEHWNPVFPFEYSGTALTAFLLGATGWMPANFLFARWFNADHQIQRVIANDGDPFESLLYSAFLAQDTVGITLINEKVYIGFITAPLNPALPMKSVGILPTQSGYRDETDKRYIFTTYYEPVYEKIVKAADRKEEQLQRFLVMQREAEGKKAYIANRLADMAEVDPSDAVGLATRQDLQRQSVFWDRRAERMVVLVAKCGTLADELADTAESFELVIPASQIRSMHLFNQSVYEANFQGPTDQDRLREITAELEALKEKIVSLTK